MCPDAARRWCTSDHQRGPIRKVITAWSPTCVQAATTAVHLLNAMDSAPRRTPRAADECPMPPTRRPVTAAAASTTGTRSTTGPSPRCGNGYAAGTRSHAAYAAGMSRLSCRFCVLSSRADLVCSARLNPDLADRYAEVERGIGHRVRRPHDGRRDRRSTPRRPARADPARRHPLAAIPARSTRPTRNPSLRTRQRPQRSLISSLEQGAPPSALQNKRGSAPSNALATTSASHTPPWTASRSATERARRASRPAHES